MNPEKTEQNNEQNNQEKLKSRVICAWCGKIMGEVEGIAEGQDSHGVCPECRKQYFPKTGEEK